MAVAAVIEASDVLDYAVACVVPDIHAAALARSTGLCSIKSAKRAGNGRASIAFHKVGA
jgi:hypothetical protein